MSPFTHTYKYISKFTVAERLLIWWGAAFSFPFFQAILTTAIFIIIPKMKFIFISKLSNPQILTRWYSDPSQLLDMSHLRNNLIITPVFSLIVAQAFATNLAVKTRLAESAVILTIQLQIVMRCFSNCSLMQPSNGLLIINLLISLKELLHFSIKLRILEYKDLTKSN